MNDLQALTLEQLAERFVDLALSHEDARRVDDSARLDSVERDMRDVASELKARGQDQWRTLLPFVEHSSDHVRRHALKAMLQIIAIEPPEAGDGSATNVVSGPEPAKTADLSSMTIDALIERFVAAVIAEDQARGFEEWEPASELVEAVERELEHREGDQRRALLPLYMHSDAAVRYRAATATRDLTPELSRSRLLAIDDPEWSPELDDSGSPKGETRRRQKLREMSIEQLAERFLVLAREQGDAIELDEIPRCNRLFGLIEAIGDELESREGDQRRALIPLLRHRDANVRFKAAMATREVAPEDARRAFQLLIDRHEFPQAADARSAIEWIDAGGKT